MNSTQMHDQRDQDERAEAVAEQRDPDQELDQDVEPEAAAATAAATAAAAAEAGGAAAGGGERGRRERSARRARSPAAISSARRRRFMRRTSAASGPTPGLVLRHVLVGVVAAAHERAGRDVLEPELVGGLLELP